MHVGVFLGAFGPDVGGGYTLQTDVFSALCELSSKTKHNFSVFYNPIYGNKIVQLSTAHKNLEMVPMATPSALTRAISALKQDSLLVRKVFRGPGSLEKLAFARKVHLLWFIVGGAYRFFDIPYIATVWDLQHRIQPWFPEVSAQGQWELRETTLGSFLRRATFVVTGTDEGRRQIENLYQIPSQRTKILPLPTPGFVLRASEPIGKSVLEKYGLSAGYLFYPAQFWPHKNHANLILALKCLRDSYGTALQLVFVGSDQGNLSYVRSFVEKNDLVSQVRFLGFVSRDELLVLYRNALAMPFVTYFGPDNLPPLEAFALGCPVIASDIPGAKEQLGDAALFVDPSNPDKIASAVIRLIEDTGIRNRLLQKGRERAVQWTGRDYIKGMFAMFDEFESVRRCWS